MDDERPTFGELFAGIGGFGLGLERSGWRCAWQVEKDAACRRVLAEHWPDVQRFEDVCDVGANELAPVDLICGGWPCQDLSVAGRRAGLAGERSGLFTEFARIVGELRPRYVLGENVPGLLSSEAGDDLRHVVGTLTKLGYATDISILDAQDFGLAQRRRRVFIACERSDALLSRRTQSSERTVADLQASLLLACWDAILQASLPVGLPWGSIPQTVGSRGSPTLRISACENLLGAHPWSVLRRFWGSPEAESWDALDAWTSLCHDAPLMPASALCAENDGNATDTERSWSASWDDPSRRPKWCTTSTWMAATTAQRICIFSQLAARMVAHMARSIVWSPASWQMASYVSTLIGELTNCARAASSDLYSDAASRDRWHSHLAALRTCAHDVERGCRAALAEVATLCPESESCDGNPAPSRTARSSVAGALAAGAHPSGFNGQDAHRGNVVVSTLQGGGKRGHRVDAETAAGGGLVVSAPERTTTTRREGGSS